MGSLQMLSACPPKMFVFVNGFQEKPKCLSTFKSMTFNTYNTFIPLHDTIVCYMFLLTFCDLVLNISVHKLYQMKKVNYEVLFVELYNVDYRVRPSR